MERGEGDYVLLGFVKAGRMGAERVGSGRGKRRGDGLNKTHENSAGRPRPRMASQVAAIRGAQEGHAGLNAVGHEVVHGADCGRALRHVSHQTRWQLSRGRVTE